MIVDTNIFLRLVLNDVPELAKQAEQIFSRAKSGQDELFVPQIVIFEIYFALDKYYHFSKSQIVDALSSILAADYLKVQDSGCFHQALEIYIGRNISFVDCFLIAFSQAGEQGIETFDSDLKKLSKTLV